MTDDELEVVLVSLLLLLLLLLLAAAALAVTLHKTDDSGSLSAPL